MKTVLYFLISGKGIVTHLFLRGFVDIGMIIYLKEVMCVNLPQIQRIKYVSVNQKTALKVWSKYPQTCGVGPKEPSSVDSPEAGASHMFVTQLFKVMAGFEELFIRKQVCVDWTCPMKNKYISLLGQV